MSAIQGLGTPVTGIDITQGKAQPAAGGQSDFADTLREGMRQVEQLHGDAQQKTQDLLGGNGQDLHSAMIAVQKAELSFQLMMQVRNKIVQAYQEVARMNF